MSTLLETLELVKQAAEGEVPKKTVKEKLKGYEENTNNNIWNNELLNKQFAEEVKEINDIKKENTSEQIAKNDEVLNKTKNATTVDEIKEVIDSEKIKENLFLKISEKMFKLLIWWYI